MCHQVVCVLQCQALNHGFLDFRNFSVFEYEHYEVMLLVNRFLRAKAATGTALVHLSHRNFVCSSVCLSITRVGQSKMVQARITKSSPSAAWKTIVLGSVQLFFHKFKEVTLNEGVK